MAQKELPRNVFVLASFERRNNLGKASVIESRKGRQKHDRKFQKNELKKMIKRGDFDGPFFLCPAA